MECCSCVEVFWGAPIREWELLLFKEVWYFFAQCHTHFMTNSSLHKLWPWDDYNLMVYWAGHFPELWQCLLHLTGWNRALQHALTYGLEARPTSCGVTRDCCIFQCWHGISRTGSGQTPCLSAVCLFRTEVLMCFLFWPPIAVLLERLNIWLAHAFSGNNPVCGRDQPNVQVLTLHQRIEWPYSM